MAKARSKGRFIVLEGLDGAGTTTQCAALAKVLREQGREVLVTNEPSSGPIGTMIRQALGHRLQLPTGAPLTQQTLALLFAADRVDHLASEVEPAIARGAWVLCDRYLLSSLAYQGVNTGFSWVGTLNSHARTPDVTLFLSIDPTVAGQRRKARGGREELYEADEVQRRTAKAYARAIAMRRKAGERIVILDGSASIDRVTQACLDSLTSLSRR